ncbi:MULTISPECIES: LuxR family transcriptional regulator [Acinetobacter]|jgi:LuxR family transcriptional regulator|uniref:LuxR family transcriptional regulator n=1 Tax=Acinetobacter TaxID=469 RepID=UPI00124E3B25|nr:MULTISPECIES: LuxR family transcriptional regulator [Acinetobacter]MDA3558031.1 LuxR family transcriptional regulator [Acinetobacter sp. AOR15_HL]MDA3570626.1 LuxR family transcriptional regulator [Acinetobacter sp. AOR14_HL]
MENWQEDLLSASLNAKDTDQLFDIAKSISAQLGYGYCAYGMHIPLSIAQPKTILLNNYPEEWQQRYAERHYIAIDPTVRHCLNSLKPLIWTSQTANKQLPRDFWDEAQSYGLNVGWSQSCRDLIGTQGMLTLARSADPISEQEQKSQSTKIFWLAQMLHNSIAKIVNDRECAVLNLKLSTREKEVLRWSAEGKTSSEIALILSISERTVTFHVVNAMQKLNVNNKISAVIRAVMLGLL